jgi:hypothetical protein
MDVNRYGRDPPRLVCGEQSRAKKIKPQASYAAWGRSLSPHLGFYS